MKQQYLIYGFIAIVLVGVIIWTKLKNQKPQPDTNTKRPPEHLFPTKKVENDKLVIVDNVSESDISKILQEFCNLYNKESYKAIPKLTKQTEKKFVITFPYDIDFDIYCYFINYVNYPMGFDRRFTTIGWTTTKPTDTWITEKSLNKNVMLFVSDSDTEYDNVFLTTSDNIGFKLGFALGEEKQLLENPDKKYVKPPIDISTLSSPHTTEFK